MFPYLLLVCLVFTEGAKKLPSYVEQCYLNDPEIKDCLIRNIQNLKPKLPGGIPELLVPSLTPLEIPSAKIAAAGFTCDLSNVKLYHVDDFTIKSISFDPKTLTWDIEIHMPSVGLESDFRLKGKLLILQLDSTGYVVANLTGIDLKYQATTTKVEHKGNNFYSIKDSKMNIHVDKFKAKFSELFKDNAELTERANQVINENDSVLLDEFSPVLAEIIKNIINHILENLFKTYTSDTLLPTK